MAWTDIYAGTYYPALSLYCGATVRLCAREEGGGLTLSPHSQVTANFGPKFKHPPTSTTSFTPVSHSEPNYYDIIVMSLDVASGKPGYVAADHVRDAVPRGVPGCQPERGLTIPHRPPSVSLIMCIYNYTYLGNWVAYTACYIIELWLLSLGLGGCESPHL